MKSTRREFITVAGSAALYTTISSAQSVPATPWFKRTFRWGQTSLTESDAAKYDTGWWREQWKTNAIQGTVIDAGGVTAYYPSKVPLHALARTLGNRDAFGELSDAAHRDGLVVLASVDSGGIGDDVLKAHPEWAARTQSGQPVRVGSRYAPCVNSSWVEGYLHPVVQEIIAHSHPEGIVGNHWEGLRRDTICYCENCVRAFKGKTGKDLPKSVDWTDAVYRDWIRWSYARRLEIWDVNNKVTKAAGGPNCLWIGLNSGQLTAQSTSFRNTAEIARRSPFLLVENLSRQNGGGGFWQNTETGHYMNGLGSWNSVVVEASAMYQAGATVFSRVSEPPAEGRLWMISGIAGGFQPKYDAAANSGDRRMYQTAAPVMQWHKKNEAYLANRTPVATVGVVWSQSSADFYGRDAAASLVETPYRGMLRALCHNRIPSVPVDIDNLDRDAAHLTAIVLPNIGSMSSEQCAAVSRFVERGGGLLASGVTSLYDGDGQARADFGLAAVLGAHLTGPAPDRMFASVAQPDPGAAGSGRGAAGRGAAGRGAAGPGASGAGRGAAVPAAGRGGGGAGGRGGVLHSYLRLRPELRATMSGPHKPNEPHDSGTRHPALAGFEATDILPFGSLLVPSFHADANRSVLCTYVPVFPQLPTDAVWMREERTDIPGLIVGTYGKGKVAFMPADLDRRYGTDPLPDHGKLLGNVMRWVAGDSIPLTVEGVGSIGVYLYRQPNRLILHVVNETGADNQREPIDTYSSVGPFNVSVRLPSGVKGQSARLLVADRAVPFKTGKDIRFEIPRVSDHEVVVIG